MTEYAKRGSQSGTSGEHPSLASNAWTSNHRAPRRQVGGRAGRCYEIIRPNPEVAPSPPHLLPCVGRRVARKSADLRGGRHVSRTAASSAADPTESYAPGKSHEISRRTPCPASVPSEDDTKCYAWGARVPHASTEKPHSPGPIAHTGTRRRRIIRYYAATTRCTTAWKLWPSVASLEHRNGAEHLRRA